jgi:hypothetical protein
MNKKTGYLGAWLLLGLMGPEPLGAAGDTAMQPAAAPLAADEAIEPAPSPVDWTSATRLQVTPPVIPIGRAVPVTVTLRHPPQYPPLESLTLQRLDKAGQPMETLRTFRDDGKAEDEQAGDGLWTVRVALVAESPAGILLQAAAGFQKFQGTVPSLPVNIPARAGVSVGEPRAVVDGGRIVFRGPDGKSIRQESLAPPGAEPAAGQPPPQDRPEQAFTSADGTHVGLLRPRALPPGATADAQAPVPSGWEFSYQDANGVLWSKTTESPEHYFYFPDDASLLSEDGGRVLLVEVEEDANDPMLSVFDRNGNVLLREKAKLAGVDYARISRNGRYLLLRGLPPVPKEDLTRLIVIDIDHPGQRWTVDYHGGRVTAEQFLENARGGFDIWFNGRESHSFPR